MWQLLIWLLTILTMLKSCIFLVISVTEQQKVLLIIMTRWLAIQCYMLDRVAHSPTWLQSKWTVQYMEKRKIHIIIIILSSSSSMTVVVVLIIIVILILTTFFKNCLTRHLHKLCGFCVIIANQHIKDSTPSHCWFYSILFYSTFSEPEFILQLLTTAMYETHSRKNIY